MRKIDNPKAKRKMVPMFSAADFFSGKEDAKPGRLDERPGPTRSGNCRAENAGKSFGRQSYWYGIGYFR